MKKETVEEFLKRGGKVKKIENVETNKKFRFNPRPAVQNRQHVKDIYETLPKGKT